MSRESRLRVYSLGGADGHRRSGAFRASRAAAVAIVLGAFITAGCSSSDNEERTSEAVVDNALGTASPGGPAGQDREWEPSAWEPTVQIEPLTFTDAERESYRQEALARYVEQSSIEDAPEVPDVIAWGQGREENGQQTASCLQDAGFPAFAQPGGGIIFEPGIPESQVEASDLAWFTCEAQYPLDPAYAQEWTEDQLGLVYDYWDQYYIPCMQAQGHAIDTSGQPTREAYIAAFHTVDRISWWPTDAFHALPLETQATLFETCPPYPPDEAMYGQ